MSSSGSGGGPYTFITEITKNIRRVTEVRVPDWIQDNRALQRLAGLSAGAAGTLVAFAEGPREFILGIVATWIVDMFLSAGAVISTQVGAAIEPVTEVPGLVGGSAIMAGATVVGVVLDGIAIVDDAITQAIAAAGPLAPVVTVGVYAVGIVVGLYVTRWLVYDGIPLLIDILLWVLPWF